MNGEEMKREPFFSFSFSLVVRRALGCAGLKQGKKMTIFILLLG